MANGEASRRAARAAAGDPRDLLIAGTVPGVAAAVDPLAVEPERADASRRQARAAALVFGAFIIVAAWALIAKLGNYFWFHGDEWDFLVTRNGGSVGDLLHPHNEHLQLLPIVAYRVLWNLFGLRSYAPYQVPVIALHLTAAVLLRSVMRRGNVNPWIATAAASVFVLFGPGEENIIWAFQIGFTGTLVFGLSQLLLADHDGPFGRRDWLALGFGFLALLSSGLAPLFTAIVGAVVLVRRGWRPAAFQVIPLGVVYAAWWLAIGPDQIKDPYGHATDWGAIVHFVKTGVVATFKSMASGSAPLAVLYGVVLVAGLAVAWLPLPKGQRLRTAVMPLSLLLAGVLFLFVSGYGRWWIGPSVGNSSRYVHLMAAFSLPALAVAVDALTRRWRPAVVLGVVVLVATIPYGIGQFDTNPPFGKAYFEGRRELIAALGRSKYLNEVPRSTRPDPAWSPITDEWLLDTRRTGKLPVPSSPGAANDPTFRLRFGLTALDRPAPKANCRTERGPVDVSLRKGDELGVYVGPWSKPKDGWFFAQEYTIQLLENGRPVGSALAIHPDFGHLLRAQFDHLQVRFGLAPGTEAFILCR